MSKGGGEEEALGGERRNRNKTKALCSECSKEPLSMHPRASRRGNGCREVE